LPMSAYALKHPHSKLALLQTLPASGPPPPPPVHVLTREEAYTLWPGKEEYVEAFLDQEASVRELLKIPRDHFVVFISHHVAFLWETRKILEELALFPKDTTSIVFRVDPNLMRRTHTEREMVEKAYAPVLKKLKHVIIDERIGVGLLLQFADLVITSFVGTVTEHAAMYRKPTIVVQAGSTINQINERKEFPYAFFHVSDPSLISDICTSLDWPRRLRDIIEVTYKRHSQATHERATGAPHHSQTVSMGTTEDTATT
jgi:hypothetical protein